MLHAERIVDDRGRPPGEGRGDGDHGPGSGRGLAALRSAADAAWRARDLHRACELALRGWWDALRTFAMSFGVPADLADDVVQNAFTRVFVDGGEAAADAARPLARELYYRVRNEARTAFRRVRRENRLTADRDVDLRGGAPLASPEARLTLDRLFGLVDDDVDRSILVLYVFERERADDVARIVEQALGVRLGADAVRKRAQRIRQRLACRLRPGGEEER